MKMWEDCDIFEEFEQLCRIAQGVHSRFVACRTKLLVRTLDDRPWPCNDAPEKEQSKSRETSAYVLQEKSSQTVLWLLGGTLSSKC